MSDIVYTGKVNPQARSAGQISPDAIVQIIDWYVSKYNILTGGSTGGSETDPVFTAAKAANENISGVWTFTNGLIASNFTQA